MKRGLRVDADSAAKLTEANVLKNGSFGARTANGLGVGSIAARGSVANGLGQEGATSIGSIASGLVGGLIDVFLPPGSATQIVNGMTNAATAQEKAAKALEAAADRNRGTGVTDQARAQASIANQGS